MNETDVETGFQKLEKIDEENFDPERNSQNIVEVHQQNNTTANVQTENVVIESESKTEKADLENSEDPTKDYSLKEDNNDPGIENNFQAKNENAVTETENTTKMTEVGNTEVPQKTVEVQNQDNTDTVKTKTSNEMTNVGNAEDLSKDNPQTTDTLDKGNGKAG